MKREFLRGSLYENGADDPDRWRPGHNNRASAGRRPEEGDLVAWRYGAWRVTRVQPVADHDLTDKELARLAEATAVYRPEFQVQYREQLRPWDMSLRHEAGPLLLEPDWPAVRLRDGTTELHFRLKGGRSGPMVVLLEPYQVCSCHGHIWPCQEIDQAEMAAHAGRKMDQALATTEPGVCAACLEPITTRQKSVTFPEESRMVPGAPGPTYHAGRGACWAAVEKYERTGRLVDNPDVVRLASCPGVQFVHDARGLPADQRIECTAGPLCTGHHGPPGYHAAYACWHQLPIGSLAGVMQYVRPPTDCGYRSGGNVCMGSIIDGSSAADAVAGDERWARNNQGGGLSI